VTPEGEETAALLRRLPGVRTFKVHLDRAEQRTPAMRRLRFTGAGVDTLAAFPGQDLMVEIPVQGHGHLRRRYTIRKLEPEAAAVELEIVLHGDGLGASWARCVHPGQSVDVLGPRGKIGLAADVGWHLFCGDESALPAIFTMVEALPAGSLAMTVVEVAGKEEHQEPEGARAKLAMCWVDRNGDAPGTGTGLQEALAGMSLPSGPGHAYIFGELSQVSACRTLLIERGIPSEAIAHKAYWRRGVANAAHGEPQRPGTA
jgi:NADPH-dependent ferric siderophore reductase